MKKNSSGAKFSIAGYLFFLIPLSLTVGFSVMIYGRMAENNLSNTQVALFILLYIFFATLLFSLFDIIRRRLMVDRPVEQILEATEKIAKGDFKTKLIPLHSYYKYDDYDLIMENINQMASELSKSEILKKSFISNVSHEIKTPLSVIKNYAKALQNENLDAETRKKYLETLVVTSEKLSNLVSNILKLNKLENQSISPENTTFEIGELLRECVLQYENLFEKKNIELVCDISDITYTADPTLVEIVFNNLISNAIKFTDENGKIKVSLKRRNNDIVFVTKDNGCGMNKDVGAHIFEKFYQGDTSHSGEGNGLGLALVKQVIDIMGGTIEIQSEENKGSTFTVKFKKD